ncbi:MAG UNVERIFIED_CONTAM: hypothetical protein LVR29_31835 [Microcystis novacekii LVE1205-3]
MSKGLPSMFGFTVYSSINQGNTTGKIPYPTRGEKVLGGHAIDAVGYDDNLKIKNTNAGGIETTGALLDPQLLGTAWEALATAGCPTSTSSMDWQLIGGR